ncbi:MAG TPA: aminodeoxychorismate synthase component I [Burkholderiales bacterium]|nr:aminodeoxychorismate synthase component I [Burkholderiales bacterium]
MLNLKILPYIEPNKIFQLVENRFGTIFLDSNFLHSHYGRYSYIVVNPLKEFVGHSIDNQIEIWHNLYQSNICSSNEHLPPFIGGLVGYLSYDLCKELENIREKSDISTEGILPYWFGLYNQVFAFDNIKQICYLIVVEINGILTNYQEQLGNLISVYNKAKQDIKLSTNVKNAPTKPISPKFVSNFTQNEYLEIIQKAMDYIRSGDIFEVNLSHCFQAELPENYLVKELYQKLRTINKAPFSAFINLDSIKILSSSPERFLSIRERKIETRPIKGTIKRSDNKEIDIALKVQLQKSEKDIAENIMIVDLMRNDLSKICNADSVNVTQLCAIESFTNVHHLVSVIEGELKATASIFDIIKACFPAGSITGAPKIRAMQIIDELENSYRGVYCGSIGYFSLNGNVDLSVAIRTIVINNSTISYHVGGAVTLDSNPIDEYNETLLKGQKLNEAL